ncbi:S-adenosyl-L-methionine-dependent methyltransferase [Choiromyces venosus 120613-1]|uniref:S-adenosyl-L-methionine-dependent methyltransferase n=1 Tax=Choiromyces venosus 120613-1 TaxID=1336337 RepID=A0A3N4JYX9_9PEZI|nr:S-adenosyl-L-methionine-dependent methyltransferase [Choiromyces venosus 120613-1]
MREDDEPQTTADGGSSIAVDSSGADDYSIYSNGTESATTSLKSSVLDFEYENGRRYHAYKKGGENILAPIGDNPQRILDVGTGTGIWAMDVADRYPSAVVIGNDLSPIQPTWVPPNIQFEVDDVEAEWTYAADSFDLVHIRYMMACISDWPKLFKQAYRVTKPGGYLESAEPTLQIFCNDGSLDLESPMAMWSKNMIKSADLFGKPGNIAHLTKGWMIDAGFVNVEEKILRLPVGPWPKDPLLKEIGRFNMLSGMQGLDGFTLALFTRVLGWSAEDVMKFIQTVKDQLLDRRTHAFANYHVVYGRKPEPEEK